MPRDYSRWALPGRPVHLMKGPFLFAVFEDFIADRLTLAQVHHAFRFVEELLPGKYGNRVVCLLRSEVTDEIRFARQPIRTADNHYVLVSNQWSWKNFSYVLKSVQQAFGLNPIQGCNLTDNMRTSLKEAGVLFQETNC